MNLHRALGVPGASSADSRNFMVIGLVGAVLRTGKQSFPAPPSSYRSPACFAILRWGGIAVGRTPSCSDLCEPVWCDQVSLGGSKLTASFFLLACFRFNVCYRVINFFPAVVFGKITIFININPYRTEKRVPH